MFGRELLDRRLRLLLENQPGFTFTGILHHLHLHLFTGEKANITSHQCNST